MSNIVSLSEWKATHQRKQVVWTSYEVVPDPTHPRGWRLELFERKLELDLD